MAGLGHLERAVMELLWAETRPQTAYELRDRLAAASGDRELAATTVLTVLSRLEKKAFVRADRGSRPHRYTAVASRADHIAELMHEALGDAGDRRAVLERFVGGVSSSDAAVLRQLLDGPR
ncbi:BlaI/MecI/CopY family transcriptional regulator [Lysinimonas soli]|uniref:BlaI/MecI/CopY family transcriptional regulator n=1 Tax=Lysinimonas soli TaxID=1074233 RepID=A0ABW0NQT0_9MICO